MLNLVLALLLAVPAQKALLDPDKDPGTPSKITENSPGAIVLSSGYPGGNGWRVAVLTGEGHQNMVWVNDTILVIFGNKFSGDATYFLQGLTEWISYDGGQTIASENDIDVTPTQRSYPDAALDPVTKDVWCVTQIYGSAGRKLIVVKDENVEEFGGGVTTTYEFVVNAFGPSIIAYNGNVVFVYSDNATGQLVGFKSTDAGGNWAPITVTDTAVGTYQPDLYLIDENTLVCEAISYDGTMKYLYFWVSYDFGETWTGPFVNDPTPLNQYGFETWWYDQAGVVFNGKVYQFAAYGIPGYEGGALYAYVFDPTTQEINEIHIQGEPVYDTTGAIVDIVPYAVIPCPALTMDGRYLFVFYLSYVPTIDDTTYGWMWCYRWSEDGINWSDQYVAWPDDGANAAYNSRSEITCQLPVIYGEQSSAVKYAFLGGYSTDTPNPYDKLILLAGSTAPLPSVSENARPTFRTYIVRMGDRLSVAEGGKVSVSIYNVSGRRVYETDKPSFNVNLGKGLYFMNVTVDGKTTSSKLIVR